jgi:hypothetical protein
MKKAPDWLVAHAAAAQTHSLGKVAIQPFAGFDVWQSNG